VIAEALLQKTGVFGGSVSKCGTRGVSQHRGGGNLPSNPSQNRG
jgi:hypothetical protein